MRICFVCLGNICRSPTAEGVFLSLIQGGGGSQAVTVDSAGTAGWHTGKGPDSRAVAAAAKRGYTLPSKARQFLATDFDSFDLVLAMDQENFDVLQALAMSDHDRAKVQLFRSYDPASHQGAEVPDPYYGGEQGFDEVLDICERASRGLWQAIQSQ